MRYVYVKGTGWSSLVVTWTTIPTEENNNQDVKPVQSRLCLLQALLKVKVII